MGRSFRATDDRPYGLECEAEAKMVHGFAAGASPRPTKKCEAEAKTVQGFARAPSVFCFAKSTSLPEGGSEGRETKKRRREAMLAAAMVMIKRLYN